MRSAEDMGKMQYQKCVVNRISSTATVFNDTIHKNNQILFLRRNQIPPLRFPIFRMMSSCSPVCIYLANPGKVTWMPSLLMKIMPGPNSWHRNGIMHHTSKSDWLECLEPFVSHPEYIPKVDIRIIDGAALVHMLDPHKSNIPIMTFRDYF